MLNDHDQDAITFEETFNTKVHNINNFNINKL